MKHASNPRRGRGRSNGKRNQNTRSRNFESGGTDQKVRGTAQQVLDKYLTLARDATSAGDRIAAEGFFQHAEHYYRILHSEDVAQGGKQNNDRNRQSQERSNSAPSQNEQKNSSDGTVQATETTSAKSNEVRDQVENEPQAEQDDAPVATDVQAEPSAPDASAEEKPRRRGRPRKADIAEKASKDGAPSETAA